MTWLERFSDFEVNDMGWNDRNESIAVFEDTMNICRPPGWAACSVFKDYSGKRHSNYISVAEERLRQSRQRQLIAAPHNLAAGVHGQQTYADVSCSHGQVGGDDGSDGAAAPGVGVLDESLIGYIFLCAQINEGSENLTIPTIGLVAGCF